ncbi:hypothetical protein [Kitasatospora sp. NPDC087315]|uniref:hypothetical protein n=1 Tax=Kitasatospora sp. NPDC087315 TaxID=3364069 RepID=UPI00381A8C7A
MMQDPHAVCQLESGQIPDVDRISTLSGDISDHGTHPPSPARAPRGSAAATQAALERARARVAQAEADSGLPALSLGPDQAAQVRTMVRYVNAHPYLARLGGGERLTAHLYVAHANRTGYATPGLNRVGALLGVDAETAGDYLTRVTGMGFLRNSGRTRRADGSLSVYRVAVRPITDAAARGVARRMTASQCAVLTRWTVALLSDPDVSGLSPDDRWRLLLAAAEYTDGVFFGTQHVLGGLWGLSSSGTRKAVARMRRAGVLTSEQLRDGGKMGLSRWCIVPIVAAVATARAGFPSTEEGSTVLPDGTFAGLDRRPFLPDGPFKINYGSDLHKHQIAAGQDQRPVLPGQNAHPSTLLGELSVQKVREVAAETDGTVSTPAPSKPDTTTGPKPMRITEGTRLLGSVCARLAMTDPRWTQVTGVVLEHQGLVVDGLLAAGWLAGQVDALLAGRPLPHPAEITTSIGAVVAGRLRAAAAGPVPQPQPADPTTLEDGRSSSWWLNEIGPRHSSTEAANRTVVEAEARVIHPECEGQDGTCGRPANPGELCRNCDPRPTTEELAATAAFARWAAADAKFRGLDTEPNSVHRGWLDGWELDGARPENWHASDSEASEAEKLIGRPW